MERSRQEYWGGFPCPPQGYLPKPEIQPRSPALQVNSSPTELPGKPVCVCVCVCVCVKLFKTELKSDAGGESFPGKRCWLNHLLTWLEKTFVNVIVKTLLCVEHSAMALFGPFSSFKKKTYYKWNEWAIIHAVCQLEWWMGSRKK